MSARAERFLWVVICAIAAGNASATAAAEPGEDGGPRIIWPDDRVGEPIRASATDLLGKLLAGDGRGAKALFAGADDDARLLTGIVTCVRAEKRFRQALSDRFGDVANPDLDALFYAPASDVRGRLMVLKGGRASISSATATLDLGYRLARGKDGWRVTGLTAEAADAAGYHKYLESLAAIAADVAARIEAGKFDEADVAIGELLDRSDEPLQHWASREPAAHEGVPPILADVQHLAGIPARVARGLLGIELRSDEVVRFVARLPGLPSVQEHERGGRVDSRDAGVSVVYRGDRAIVRMIHLFAAGEDGHRQYPGELPEGLTFADTRADVERKLGRPFTSDGETTYLAMYPRHGIEVAYEAGAPRDPAVRVRRLTMTAPVAGGDGVDEAVAAGGGDGGKPTLAFRLVVDDGDGDDPTLELLTDPDAGVGGKRMLVSREVLLDAGAVAKVTRLPAGELGETGPILLEMTPEGAAQLGRLSAANLNRRLAIVLDGRVLIAPVIRSVVRDQVAIQCGADATDAETDDVLGRLHAAIHALP